MARSIRLRRPEDAAFWAARALPPAQSKTHFMKLAQVLFKSAVRDNLNIDAMLDAELAVGDPAADLPTLAKRLASTEKLWSVPEGRQLVQIICAAQSDARWARHT